MGLCFSDLQSCVLSSVELQVLTSSCFKLRTVHNIPVTSNKDGKKELKFFFFGPLFASFMLLLFHDHNHNVNCRNTPWLCLELIGTQKCILPFQYKKPQNGGWGGVRSAGGNVGYNMFLIQLMAACATQYDGCGLF